MTQSRWSIYIDLQGFSRLYEREDQILWSLGELMLVIFRVGTRAYPSVPDRLFVHQTGDGFVIVSDFHEPSPLRAIAIATVLLRRVASSGRFARAAILEGELADIVGCYPREVTNQRDEGEIVLLGEGLMTLFPVMGTALIRAFGIEKIGPRGPLLLLDQNFLGRIPTELTVQQTGDPSSGAPLSVDWIHTKIPLVDNIWSQAEFPDISDGDIERILIDYQRRFKLDKWTHGLTNFLKLSPEALYVSD